MDRHLLAGRRHVLEPRDVQREIAELPSGINTLTIDAPLDDIVGGVESQTASVVLRKKNDDTVIWCGPF
jgi:hypothetical protein